MAKFNIKTVKPKFTITTAPDNKIDVVVNKPILTAKNTKTYFKLKNTGGLRGEKGDKGDTGTAATIAAGTATSLPSGSTPTVTNTGTSSAAVFNFGIPKGDKGDAGAPGAPGQAATISVGSTTTGAPGTNASVTNVGTSSAAVLNFTVPRGATGAAGAPGAPGAPGQAATVSVGTTTTGAAGTNASVTNSGTSSAAVLDFTIPKGDKGDAGSAATITVGNTTTGNPGTNASVVNTGTSSAAVLDFTIPKGAKGDPGDPGTAATIAVGTTSTLPAGSSATVTNTGTSSAAVFDFGVPKGDKGDTGNPGDAATVAVGTVTTGEPGTSATVVNSGTSSAAVLDFTIPRGDKGEPGSGAGDMLAADYDPNGTVQNAGGIVDYVESQIPAENMFYATCTTAAALAAKVATTTSGDFTLTTGNMVRVKFTNAQAYNGTATLNVDSTGAINITRVDTTTITRYWWMAGEVVDFVYDGTNFVMSNKGTATTTYYGLTKLSSSTSSTSTALAATPSAVKAAYDLANSKQDALTAGSNISISNNTISAIDTTYTAGNNISISGTTISATVPTTTSDLTNDGSDGTSTYVEADELATVATSGAYSDLSGAPTVNDATLTIQKNGSSVATFTANSSTATTANITVPTATSDLTNDSGFITDAGVTSFNGSTGAVTYTAPVTSVNGSTGAVTVTVPTKTSDLTNDSGFLTSYTETDPIYSASPAAGITDADILSWNAKSDFSGDYDDLTNKPTIGNATLTIQKNGTNVQTFTANATSNKTANITVPTKTSDLTNDSDFVEDASYVHTDNNYTTAEKNKLAGIAAGAEVNVQANWTQTTTTADDYIKNKPTLATVATSGSYNDLSNKPTIPTVNNATLTIQKNGTTVKTFTANASSNVTANITVPTKTSDLTNDSGFLDSVAWGDVTGKPTFATVATSGSYNDLTNKPTIPAAQVNSDWNATSGKAQILNKPTLATVATSGSYNDLNNKPTIPTVNNAALTIQKNGTTVKTFTANASSNVTANITVPTRTSELTNNSGFLTTSTLPIVTSISSSSTDSQVPSAKCMYTAIGDVESILTTLNNGGGAQ